MTASILSSAQLAEFTRRGVLRIPSLLPVGAVSRARVHVQSRLARWHDDNREGPEPVTLKAARVIGNKHPAIGALIEEPALLSAVDALLEGQAFDHAAYIRPQVLVTLPCPALWTAPSNWHVDVPRLASGRSPGMQLFTFLDCVEPRGGGTLVMAGSHCLLNDGRLIRAQELRRLLRREAFFSALFSPSPAGSEGHARLTGHSGEVAGITLEVIELTGEPGDVWFTDLRLLHTGAPNASLRTRLMVTHRFVRTDVVPELAHAVGA
jgi:ectoine hydroxylase-related dioxygenase (phytanoyl-CoA dioxygenase family)